MEDMRNEAARENSLETARSLLLIGKLTYEEIAQATKLTVDEVKELDEKRSAYLKITGPLAYCVKSYMVRWWASFFTLTRMNHRQHPGIIRSAAVAYAVQNCIAEDVGSHKTPKLTVQITLKRNDSSASAERLFHF